jgi:hypothetical protein
MLLESVRVGVQVVIDVEEAQLLRHCHDQVALGQGLCCHQASVGSIDEADVGIHLLCSGVTWVT